MSLYNNVVGYDPLSFFVLWTLEIEADRIPRFRDAYLDIRGPEPVLAIFTRTGGANRVGYDSPGEGPRNQDLRELEGYIEDVDDDYDSTFAHFRYRVPEGHREAVADAISQGRAAGWEFPAPMERFKAALRS